MEQNSLLENESIESNSGPVECLGLTFENDEARRTHFTNLLAEKLKDPEFRKIEGFPIGTDEAILELSDPPYYTACPNPWLNEFISLWESQKEMSGENYHREPFSADVSIGKNHPIYAAHSYHTKVPHEAIIDYIEHYTNPGDIVLDGFSGSGMTGLAAKMSGSKTPFKSGHRFCLLNDLSPLSGHITYNNNNPISSIRIKSIFEKKLKPILKEIEEEFYLLDEGELTNYVIWSDCYLCSECGEEYDYWTAAVSQQEGEAKKIFPCPNCNAEQNTRQLTRSYRIDYDELLGKPLKLFKQIPVRLSYFDKSGKKKQRELTQLECDTISNITFSNLAKNNFPVQQLVKGDRWKRDAFDSKGISHVHHFYTKRAIEVIARIFNAIDKLSLSFRDKSALRFVFTSFVDRNATKRNRFVINKHNPRGRVNGPMANSQYAPSLFCEMNLIKLFSDKMTDICSGFDSIKNHTLNTVIQNASSSSLNGIKDDSIDYIFTDPPFGHNIQYSELNLPLESFLKVKSCMQQDIVVNQVVGKDHFTYTHMIHRVFQEYYRVLKPSRWITVEFHNSKASVWNAIQEAITKSGFVVANVATLDKKQKTIHQDFNVSGTVDKDLIISAYKPNELIIKSVKSREFDELQFLKGHLNNLPSYLKEGSEMVVMQARLARALFNTLVSYCVQRNLSIKYSFVELLDLLSTQFSVRDDMYFLPEQAIQYDKMRAKATQVKQLSIFVDDEQSAIEWLKQQLKTKPQTYQELHPKFINELSGWKKNEVQLELLTLLEQNVLKFEGKEDVPNQIHTYLSTNFKDMRGLAKDDPVLVTKAKDRWYVPDLNKAGDLEKVRLRALLREFEVYKAEKKKIKQPRAEALRAGFNHCWENQDLQTILDISAKIPPAVLQEDEKLLMFYDNALTLTSNTDDDWD